MNSVEKQFKSYQKYGDHPFFFFYEMSEKTIPYDIMEFLLNHSLSEFTVPGITFDFPYDVNGFYPETLEELIYALVMQPIVINQTEIVEFLQSDMNALMSMFRTMPFNMETELLAFVTGEAGIYHYDEEPLYLVPYLREPEQILYIRTTDMLSPVYNREEILCQLTEEEKKALDGKAIFNKKLGIMEQFDYLGLYDGVPYVFSANERNTEWFIKHASVMKEVHVPCMGKTEPYFIVPFIEEDHQDMNHILSPFEKCFYGEDGRFKYGDFTDYYRKCILKKAMNKLLS